MMIVMTSNTCVSKSEAVDSNTCVSKSERGGASRYAMRCITPGLTSARVAFPAEQLEIITARASLPGGDVNDTRSRVLPHRSHGLRKPTPPRRLSSHTPGLPPNCMPLTVPALCRDRLETVEQKVFAIELRMSAQEHRQSLPGMPPTPSRAITTPGKAMQTPGKGMTPQRVPLAQFQ